MDDYSLDSTLSIYDKYSGKTVTVKEESEFSNGSLDFDGYLKLLVAQMSNQDFNDPMSDSDLLNQMAQYSMMEGIKNMTQQSNVSYAASLVGKIVTVSEDGDLYHTGPVQAVNFVKGKSYIVVDGQSFDSSKITDIVTDEAYAEVKEFLGKTVKLKGSGEDAPTGVVEGIVFKNGQGYVSVGGEAYPIWQLEIVETDGTDAADGTESGEGTGEEGDGTETGDSTTPVDGSTVPADGNTDTSETDDESILESAEVGASSAAYSLRSQSLADVLMRELDRAEETEGTSAVSEASGETLAELEELVKTAYVEVPTYSAALYADDDEILFSSLTDIDSYGAEIDLDSNGNLVVRELSSDINSAGVSDDDVIYGDDDDDEWMGITARSAGWTTSSFNASNTSGYDSREKGVTASGGMISGGDTPRRISVEKYPAEAALADQYGTRMYDIRYINNRAITSRLKEGPVIFRMNNGMGVTEIGYSGVGQLGEVVTFENGQQRVEILLKSGKSAWYYTSGRYTLDQLCATNGAPGSLNDMTAQEATIRHYARVEGEGSVSRGNLLASPF